jgi:hypothetical protein
MILSAYQIDLILKAYYKEKRKEKLSKEFKYRNSSLVHDEAFERLADIVLKKIKENKN